MSDPTFVFSIQSFLPNPVPLNPSYIFVTGTCSNCLVAMTICSTFSKSFIGVLDPNISAGAFGASTVKYTQLRNCLDAMGTGTVQMQVSYKLVNNLFQVSDINCNVVPALNIQQQLSVIATNSTQIEQRLASDLSGGVLTELRSLKGLVAEMLSVLRQDRMAPSTAPPSELGLERLQSDFTGLAHAMDHVEEDVG
jgi:hypothetical protein